MNAIHNITDPVSGITAVLRVLQKVRARTMDKVLAYELGITASTFSKLRNQAAIEGLILRDGATILDARKLGFGTLAFLNVTLNHQFIIEDEVVKKLVSWPEIQEIHAVGQTHDKLLLKVRTRTPSELGEIQARILAIETVVEVRAHLAFSTAKETTELPL